MDHLVAGTVVAQRYELESLAGAGAMGRVFRARDRATGARVAIKVRHQAAGTNADAARFAREAALLAGLCHPGIVTCLDHGALGPDERFIVMEWLSGETLTRRLDRAPLSLTDTVAVATQVATALAAAHTVGVVHRDLKPSNLFLHDHRLDQLKIIDFGIARDTRCEDRLTRAGVVLGTPGYLAPEQARGEPTIDAAADVFALGCVLYECLAGEPPFGGVDVPGVISNTLLASPAPLAMRRPGVPPELAALIERMLAKAAAARPRDAAVLIRELATLPPMPREEPRAHARPAAESIDGQQLVSVVVCEPTPLEGDRFSTLPATSEDPRREWRASLRTELGRLGADLEWLPGSALVVALVTGGAATDQVALAARCALAVRARWPEALIAIGTGPGSTRDGAVPRGGVVDRTRAILHGLTDATALRGIWLDDLSAGLLHGRPFEIDGRLLVRARTPAGEVGHLLGRPTPFVGRNQELAILGAMIDACGLDREARVGLVLAPPGFGKTRLRSELRRRAGASTWMEGIADVTSATSPYALLSDVLRRYAELDPCQHPHDQRVALHRCVASVMPAADAAAASEFLAELCQLPATEPASAALRAARAAPAVMADQIAAAAIGFLGAACRARPVVLVLDDLHWADVLSINVIDAAMSELTDCPLLVVGFARPHVLDQFPRLWAQHRIQQIILPGLSARASEQLIDHALGDQVPPDVRTRLIRQAGGNALFLEELIRAHAEGRGGSHPDTVLAMLQGRLSRLSPAQRRVACIASVCGTTFRRPHLEALLPRGDLDAIVRALSDDEVIEPLPHDGGGADDGQGYGFRHALMRDAAYAMLSDDERRAAHARLGHWLDDRGERDHVVVAEHFRRGAAPTLAARHYLRAADQALASADSALTLALADCGLACDPSDGDRAALRGLQAQATFLSSAAQCREAGFEAMRTLPPGSARWCRTVAALLFVSVMDAEREVFASLVTDLLAATPAHDAVTTYVESLSFVLGCVGLFGDRAQALAGITRLDQIVGAAPALDSLAAAWAANARFYFVRNFERDPWTALSAGEAGVTRARACGAARLLTLSESTLGVHHEEMGNGEVALAHVRAALSGARKLRDPTLVIHAGTDTARLLAGRAEATAHAEADALVDELLAYRELTSVYRGLLEIARAQLQLHRGSDLAAAATAAAASETLRPFPLLRISALAIEARALVAGGGLDAAQARCAEGRGLVAVLGGGCTELALCRAEAEVSHATGDARGVRAAVGCLQLRAARIPDAAARARFLDGVPDHRRMLELAAALRP